MNGMAFVELDTPMPRWWLWTYYATIIFSIGYCIAYPAIPLINDGYQPDYWVTQPAATWPRK